MNSNIVKSQKSIKLNVFFNLSNKYIFLKLDSSRNEQIFSISTSSILFKGMSNRNCTIIIKLLGLVCNKILCKKKISIFDLNKMNIKYNSKINFFFNQIIKKVIF